MKNLIHFSFFFSLSLLTAHSLDASQNNSDMVDIGIILDLKTPLGIMSASYITMALSDLHADHNYTSELKLHWRDSNEDNVQAASMALDLLENVQVKAIIGPQTSSRAQFVTELGNKAHVPVLSFSATSPFLSSIKTPYFIPTAPNDSSQVHAIAAIVQAFGWKQVVPVYENTAYGAIPNLTDALEEVDVRIPYKSRIPNTATDDQLSQELSRLKEMQIRVFVVHLSPSLGSRFFLKANETGMMSEGYGWIITDSLANLLDFMNSSVIRSMHGVLGVRPYFPQSQNLDMFMERWKSNFTNTDSTELSIYGLWAYDTVWALAKAVERVGTKNSNFSIPQSRNNWTDLKRLGVSEMGPRLLDAILETNFKGLSGAFNLNDGQLEWTTFQIVNVIGKGRKDIGFWTPDKGLQRQLNIVSKKNYSVSKDDLGQINWPGDPKNIPSTWKILKIGVPDRKGFTEFVSVKKDTEKDITKVEGYSIAVFEAAINKLPYPINFYYDSIEGEDRNNPDYNALIDKVYFQEYDAVVGDTTIIAHRSLYVDFTLPYTESGVTMVVLVNENKNKAWIFLKPFSWSLWLTTGVFFVFTGFVVWALEHRINDEFRGPPSHQAGVMLWFSFSTLVFAHRERLVSNWARFVVIIWVFVAWILTSSYTASFTSLLTLQQLQPPIHDINDVIKNREYVGYQSGSFVKDLLLRLKIEESMLKSYSTAEQYAEALSKGTKNGGVGAIFDEIPYLRLLLAQNATCAKYKMVGPIYKTDGFGFVFPKGFPLVPDLSRAILNLTQGEDMNTIEKNWIGSENSCADQTTTAKSSSLTLDGFRGLFLITGSVSILVFLFFLVQFLYQNRDALRTLDSGISFTQRLYTIIMRFNEKDLSHHTSKRVGSNEGLEIGIRHGGNCPPVDASMEPSSANPNRQDSVVAEVENDARHLQTSNCQLLARRRWNQLYKAWQFRTRYARIHDYN